MYRCFKLVLSKYSFEEDLKKNNTSIIRYKQEGELIKKNLRNSFESILEESIDGNGVISGEAFSEKWFASEKYDVFISYSHIDEDLALLVAGILKDLFGLKVFIDELFWGSADQLLRKIDDKYAKNKTNNDYNYTKRNFTTAHVHAMLATAIAKTIDNSEALFFLNTANSIYQINKDSVESKTLSPWIFEEIFFSSVIRTREWWEHRVVRLDEDANFSESLKIAYKLPDKHLVEMSYNDLCEWSNLWGNKRAKQSRSRYGGLFSSCEIETNALNELYKYKFGIDKKSKDMWGNK